LLFLNEAELQPITKDNMDFSRWGLVLQRLVKVNTTIDGVRLNSFNYAALASDTNYQNFTWQIENANTAGFSYEQWYTFWINAYNYAAVRMVVEHPCAFDAFGDCHPVTSITQIGIEQPSVVTAVWTIPILRIKSLNKTLSLDEIEIDRLRYPPNKWVEDTRIHAAINCASVSCPDLFNQAYTVEKLDEQLSSRVLDWLSNEDKGARIEGTTLKLSAIFGFFPEDFTNSTNHHTNSKSLEDFITKWGPQKLKAFYEHTKDPKIAYFTYNWNMNGNVTSLCSADRICFPWWGLVIILLLVVFIGGLALVIVRKRVRRHGKTYQPINE